ncbi:hypothetical protein U1Q18_047123, partial [Sarracenia purpurea var. burkii]
MNHCAVQKKNAFATGEETKSFVSFSDKRETMVCPKPRRLGLLNTGVTDPIRSLRWHV